MRSDSDILRMKRFGGRTAVITGGGSGVGLAIALALAKEGSDLCLIGRSLENLEAAASKAQSAGARVVCCRADLAKDADLIELMRRLTVDVDGVDILVHSAAVLECAPIELASLDQFDTHYRVNIRAPYALTQVLLPTLRSRRGEVVFINSSSGTVAKPQFANTARRSTRSGLWQTAFARKSIQRVFGYSVYFWDGQQRRCRRGSMGRTAKPIGRNSCCNRMM
jgi:NAD(P)-dependent dehydrogenase (short-subunit alcohol dehydrogenase family)